MNLYQSLDKVQQMCARAEESTSADFISTAEALSEIQNNKQNYLPTPL